MEVTSKHHHWGSRLISTRSRKLYQLIQDLKFDLLSTGKPTYWPHDPNKIPDLIDFFVYKNISSDYLDVVSYSDLCSDHTPIVAPLSSTIIKKKSKLRNLVTNKQIGRSVVFTWKTI